MNKIILFVAILMSCYTSTFAQHTVCTDAKPISSFNTINIPSVSDYSFPDNGLMGCFQDTLHQAFWFTFEATKSGTFEFAAQSIGGAADYDFVLFSDDCPCNNSAANVVACNWLGLIVTPPYYATGISSTPMASFGAMDPLAVAEFEQTVNLVAGKKYFLLLDNISKNGVGFDLMMKGTASITAPTPIPHPVVVSIAGPKNVCPDSKITYTADASNQFTSYKWIAPTGVSVIENGKTATIDWKNKGGKLKFAAWNTCFTDTLSIDVSVNPKPEVTVPQPVILCYGTCLNTKDIAVNDKNNNVLNNIYYNSLAGALNKTTIDLAAPTFCNADTIWLRAEAGLGCFDTARVVIKQVKNPSIVTLSGGQVCKGDSVSYILSFTGKAPFLGTFTDGTNIFNFNTNNDVWIKKFQINTNTTFSVLIFSESSNICNKTIQGKATFTLDPKCSCVKDAGTLDMSDIRVCGNEPMVAIHNGDQKLLKGDTLAFVLHSKADKTLGTVFKTGFLPNFVKPSGVMFDTVYYLSAIVGQKDASGNIDFNDPCLSMSNGVKVVFHALPNVTFSTADTLVCKGSVVNITANMKGKAPFEINYQNGIGSNLENKNTAQFSFQSIVNQDISIKNIKLKDGNGCTNQAANALNIKVRSPLTLVSKSVDCNVAQTAYNVTAKIDGGKAASYQSSMKGTWSGSVFTSEMFKNGEAYHIGFYDQYRCDTLYIDGDNTCFATCDTAIKAQVVTLQNITCQENDIGKLEAKLNKNTPIKAYQWSNGAQSATVQNLTEGVYTVTITYGNNCIALANTTLKMPNSINASIQIDSIVCYGLETASLTFKDVTGGDQNHVYSIDNKAFMKENSFKNLKSGIYKTAIRDGLGCEWRSDIFIPEPEPLTVTLGDDVYMEPGNSLVLKPIISDQTATFTWSDPMLKELRPTVSPLEPKLYRITVKNKTGCTVEDEILVWVEGVRKAFIPNAFSPNDDGNNDSFTIFGGDDLKVIKFLRIFDRWGNMMFEASDLEPNRLELGWNGTFRGKSLDPDRFTFSTELEYTNGQRIKHDGLLMIVK